MAFYASVSFGKDSLAMLLLLLEKKMPLDEVIFYNSGMEFQAIYDIRDQIKPVLEQRGVRFTEVRPDASFLYNMLERPVDSKKNGFHLGYGWCGGPCRWGTKLKTRSLDKLALDAELHYVGIAVDETKRLGKLEAPKFSPLAEAGMTEAGCLAFCYERGFFWEENGVRLYDVLDRVSCWCCKNKNRKELKNIYQFLPQYWEQLKELQSHIPMPMKPYSRKGVPYGNVFDLERVFEREIQVEHFATPKRKRRSYEQSR
ncbi:MAG: phosphoadenosine phosphosulfate reductase family protein [Oscillibacter sp.]|nr:phosphoadenosine phosphosulfate reductase family protein [Oscillibacter sp.]